MVIGGSVIGYLLLVLAGSFEIVHDIINFEFRIAKLEFQPIESMPYFSGFAAFANGCEDRRSLRPTQTIDPIIGFSVQIRYGNDQNQIVNLLVNHTIRETPNEASPCPHVERLPSLRKALDTVNC